MHAHLHTQVQPDRTGGGGSEGGGEGGARRDGAWTARTSGREVLSESAVATAASAATAAGLREISH